MPRENPIPRFAPKLVLSALVFEWFLLHVAPTVYFGDCGEILSAVYTGGVPHPTGFPLYVLLATLVAKTGLPTLGVNALAALAATACGFLFMEVYREFRKTYFPAALSTPLYLAGLLVFLSSSTLLLHSSAARTYTLNLLCVLTALYFALKNQGFSTRQACGMGFLLGLGLDSHFLFWTVLPACGLGFWNRRKEILSKWPWTLCGLILALSLYLWIPLRSHLHPTVNWEHSDDFYGLWDYLTQKDYRFKFFARDFTGTLSYFQSLVGWIGKDRPFPFLALSLLGMAFSFSKNPRWAGIILSVVASNVLILFFYGNETDLRIGYRSFLPLHTALALWAPLGLEWLFFKWKSPSPRTQKTALWLSAGLCLALGLVFQSQWRNLGQATLCYDFAVNYLKPIPRGASVEVQGDDELFPIAYVERVRGLRPDIHVIDWDGDLFPEALRRLKENPSLRRSDVEKEDFNEAGGQLYLSYDPGFFSSMRVEPYGFCYRLTAMDSGKSFFQCPDPYSISRMRHSGMDLPDSEAEETAAEYPLMEGAYLLSKGEDPQAFEKLEEADEMGAHSIHTLNNLAQLYSASGHWEQAEADLNKAILLQPHLFKAYLNLGILYGKEGRYRDALSCFQTALKLQPGNPAANFYLQKVEALMLGGPN